MDRQSTTHPNLKIPHFCEQLLGELGLRGLQEEGIFRIAGRKVGIDELQKNADCGNGLDTSAAIHDIAGCFKKFLRELPSPLLTYRIFNNIVGDESM